MEPPFTTGELASAAMGVAADAFMKNIISEAAKRAYKALKSRIAGWAADNVLAIENDPASPKLQADLAKLIDRQPEGSSIGEREKRERQWQRRRRRHPKQYNSYRS